MIFPGSYANGFAPRDGQPLYSLWRGCVGAWNPGLGPTGLTLRDWSGYGNHGTLTSMDPGTDWTTTLGRYSLDFDGVNDVVDCGTPPGINGATYASYSVWLWRSSTGITCAVGGSAGNSTNGDRFSCIWFSDGNVYFSHGGGVLFSSLALTGTGLNHIAVNYDGSKSTNATRFRAWANGSERTLTFSGTVPAVLPTVTPWTLGKDSSNRFGAGRILDCMLFARNLNANEIRILSMRPGIAYELAPRRRSSLQVAAFNRRRRLLIGAGS
jgi:hypothetical protein